MSPTVVGLLVVLGAAVGLFGTLVGAGGGFILTADPAAGLPERQPCDDHRLQRRGASSSCASATTIDRVALAAVTVRVLTGVDRGVSISAPACPSAVAHRRARPRVLLRRGGRLALGFAAVAGTVLAAASLTTPTVGDAPGRVASLDAGHGSIPVAVADTARIAVAVVASEDGRFYSHHGVDLIGVARALMGRLTGADAGGSTLDQQLAHVLFEPDASGAWARVDEVAISLKLEGHYTKHAILDLYLNSVYFGHGYYGIGAASKGYFGLTPAQLSWGQAALLAGLVQAPSQLDPVGHLQAALTRRQYVFRRLVDDGVLTSAQASRLAATPLAMTA